MTDRREQIADAGIRILASRGARAFTHLNIDRELGIPDGSTSYYTRTRRDLITLVVERLATRTRDDLEAQIVPKELTVQGAAAMAVSALDTTMERASDHRARLALLLECQNDPELHTALATRPQVRDKMIDVATALLRQLGSARPDADARNLVGLLDALLMQRTIRTAPIEDEAIITAYLRGVLGTTHGPS